MNSAQVNRDQAGVILNGHVRWFNNAKGYGFVVEEGGEVDLFAHYTAIQMEGFKSLRAGQPILFEVRQGPKGAYAANICPRAIGKV